MCENMLIAHYIPYCCPYSNTLKGAYWIHCASPICPSNHSGRWHYQGATATIKVMRRTKYQHALKWSVVITHNLVRWPWQVIATREKKHIAVQIFIATKNKLSVDKFKLMAFFKFVNFGLVFHQYHTDVKLYFLELRFITASLFGHNESIRWLVVQVLTNGNLWLDQMF